MWSDCKEHRFHGCPGHLRIPHLTNHLFYFYSCQSYLRRGNRRLGALLLLVRRHQRLHANSSLSLTRVAIGWLWRCCLAACMGACMIVWLLHASLHVLSWVSCRDSGLWRPFLPCGVRERGSSAKKENVENKSGQTLQSLGKGTVALQQNPTNVTLTLRNDKVVYGCHILFVKFFSFS